ncbi:MAG: penicillin-binding protein [Actinomycetia bacterium]|nr:penicillin-binding protein [Actinomycetes bacterium]
MPSWRQILGLGALGVAALGAAFVALYLLIDVPEPNELATAETSVVYFDDGEAVIGRYAEVNREIVTLDQIPDHVELAVLAAEDRGFYENEGISPVGIARALWNNIRGGDTQGASTITQQYARNAYLTQERTLTRKVKEAILAIKLSRSQTKEQVLEAYLNTIYFGRGAYGIQAASQAYFGKDVDDLSKAEGAVLAAVIRAPSSYDPEEGKAAKQALETRTLDYVIPGMVEQGWLDEADAAAIKRLPEIKDPKALNNYEGQTGFLLDVVRDELRQLGFSKDEIDGGGLRVKTTFDEQAQDAAQTAATEGFPPPPNDGVKLGMVSVDPRTGAIVAMYAGKNWEKSQFNNAIAPVPVGSTMKAFTVAAALQNGYSLASTFNGNSPFYLEGDPKSVNNQGDQSFGEAISLEYATEQSVNTAFVDLTQQMGPAEVAKSAGKAGLDVANLSADDPRVTLGKAAYSPLAMASAYGTFANEGMRTEPYSVEKVTDADGAVLYEAESAQERAFPADIANEVTYDLAQVVTSGTGVTAANLGRPAAGKTGNHEGETAWFVGYTPQLVTAVAFHREYQGDPTAPLNGVAGQDPFTGGGYPTQIWTAYTSAALVGQEVLTFPGRPIPSTSPTPLPTTAAPSPTSSPTSNSATPKPSPTTSSASPKPSKTTAEPSPTSATPSPSEGDGGGGANP